MAAERAADQKHEYLQGVVSAMAGGTAEHARLASRIASALGVALRGKPCETFSSDLRVRLEETDLTSYPDVTVVCGRLETSPQDPDAVVNPVVLVEVLSETTEAYDRGEKAAHYRHCASLKEYVLVSQRARRVEVFRRGPKSWELVEFGPGDQVELASVGVRFSLDELYASALPSGGAPTSSPRT